MPAKKSKKPVRKAKAVRKAQAVRKAKPARRAKPSARAVRRPQRASAVTAARLDSQLRPAGPEIDKKTERGVHIIFKPRDPSIHGDPTDAELDQISKDVGKVEYTDVIVFAGEPWHKVGNKLRKHPTVHDDFPETILHLRTGKDSAVWWSESKFQITGIEKEHPKYAETAEKPFDEPVTHDELVDAVVFWVARSEVPVPKAKGQEYKITFVDVNGQPIDPNMDCI